MRKVGYLLLSVALLVTVGQVVHFSSALPDPVASHFNLSGEPNGWASRNTFIAIHLAVQLATVAMLVVAAEYGRLLPDSLFNMPNKGYWLHADRRDETLRYNGAILILVAGLTAIFLSGIFQLVYVANVRGDGVLPGYLFWPLFGGYLVSVLFPCGLALWKFGRLPKDALTEV